MKTDNIQDIYQLSPAQQGLLFHTLYAPESTAYCDQYRIGFKGDFNTSNFEKAWQITTERHAAFRTCFFLGRSQRTSASSVSKSDTRNREY